MRDIERRIVGALESGETVKLSKRDAVICPDGKNGPRVYRLWGNTVATINADKSITLGAIGGYWCTATTKSRINAIGRHFLADIGVYQRDFAWYWTDGTAYTGARTFL